LKSKQISVTTTHYLSVLQNRVKFLKYEEEEDGDDDGDDKKKKGRSERQYTSVH
jgi:hypothetical protein